MKVTHALLGTVLGLVGFLAEAQEASSRSSVLDIEPQSIADALNTWAQQTGFQVIVPDTDAVNRLPAPRVKGRFTAQAALHQLLADAPLTYKFINERTVAIQEVSQAAESKQRVRFAELGETRASTPSGATATDSATERTRRIEEVIVTARKREENLQDVPDAVSVLSGAQLESAGITSVPEGLDVAVGQFAVVPLGKRESLGVVWGEGTGEVPLEKLRDVIGILPALPMAESMRRFIDWASLFLPQKFHLDIGGVPVCTLKQNFNPFVKKLTVDFTGDTQGRLDKRLGLGAAILIAAIEGRQGAM